jgi:hypothetical protein
MIKLGMKRTNVRVIAGYYTQFQHHDGDGEPFHTHRSME